MGELKLYNIEVPVFLGVYAHEQKNKRIVFIDLFLKFLDIPKGCFTDNINDVITLCGGLLQNADNSLTIDRLYEDEKINVNLGDSFTFNSYEHIVFNIDNWNSIKLGDATLGLKDKIIENNV